MTGLVVYELTESCNQNCRFCYNHWRPGGSVPADARLARRTLKLLLSQTKIGSVSFSGGEPMLVRNIHDLALRCRFKGIGFNVLTNGTLLSEDDIVNFGSIGISALQIPLLSDQAAIHEGLTGLRGSWNKALGSLQAAVRILGPERVASVLVITARNADSIENTLELLHRTGVRTVMVNRFNIGGNGIANSAGLALCPAGLKRAFGAVNRFASVHPEMSFVSGVCTPMCILDPADYPRIRFTSCSTDLKDRPIAVSARGDVRFCNHSPHILGNIYERSILDILEDQSVLERYSGVPEKCAECRLFARCRGGCRAAAEQLGGSFAEADPLLRQCQE